LCTKYDAFDLGLEIIEMGLRHLPESERLIFQRGVIRAMQSQFDLAEQDFQRAARLAPEKEFELRGLRRQLYADGQSPKSHRLLASAN
jgi:hypothetical protein